MALVGAWIGLPQLGAAERSNRVTLVTSTGSHVFDVEWALTDAERERGLMFRQSMPADHGMIFDFEADQPVFFWMKNTPLPLDMVFITASGVIYRIEQNAEPYSEKNIASGGAVRYVLEINGGAAKRVGAKPGDQVLFR
ncbi:MAG: DUF192 domain-containing protein [Bauldia sp.]